MPRRRGGGNSARSGGLFAKKAAPAPRPAQRTGQPTRSGLFSGSSTKAPPPRPAPPPPARAPAQSAPPPATAAPSSGGGGMLSGLGGMVAQGMAIGTGSAIAHQAVGAVAGAMSGSGSKSNEAPPPAVHTSDGSTGGGGYSGRVSGPCALDQQELYKCLEDQNGNAGQCQYYFDALRDCQENQQFN